jgi:hypothetical protein
MRTHTLVAALTATLALSGRGAHAADDLQAMKEQLRAHMKEAQTPGEDAEERHRESLQRLRARARDTVRAARALYRESRPESYLQRWSIVHTLGELAAPEAAAALAEIATSPFAEGPRVAHDSGPTQEEAMIRLRALAGLRRLAEEGDSAAYDALKRSVGTGNRAVRATAVHEWLSAAQARGEDVDRVKREIAARLPKSDAWMLNLRRGRLDVEGRLPPPPQKTRTRTPDDAAPPAGR